jgi:hypothetical protein
MARSTHRVLIPIAAFLAVLPLLLKGSSCGHDEVFHVQGWYDAASQLRHLHYPHWSFTSAWNAGEPRFIFYPPLSWLLGALLTLILPPQAAVDTFIFLSLALSGFAMYRLASHFTSPNAALIAATLYLANPYTLLNAFERSAFAELLAAAWIPLLLLAVLRRRPTIPGIAIPLALLWLTNAPAAVMASYTLALLATLRVAQPLLEGRRQSNTKGRGQSNTKGRSQSSIEGRSQSGIHSPEISLQAQHTQVPQGFSLGQGQLERAGALAPQGCFRSQDASDASRPNPIRLAATYIAGTLLGLTLPAFYLIPAAYERRYIQVAMAVIPGMRIQDNFLFVHTGNPGHDGVNLQISLLAASLYILMAVAVIALLLRAYLHRSRTSTAPSLLPTSYSLFPVLLAITTLAATLILMLSPISIPIWTHLPELNYLQFPWRILSMVSAVFAFAVALNLRSPKPSTSTRTIITIAATLILAVTLGHIGFFLYAQFCQPNERPADIANLLRTHHGYPPTDEYTPNNADSDVLRTQNPGYWLIPATSDPNTAAPNTLPTPAELDPTLQNDDTPIPITQTISATAPMHLGLTLTQPEILILNLRDYPNWQVTAGCEHCRFFRTFPHLQRDDGLLAIPLDGPGNYPIDIHWRTLPDQTLGLTLSTLALLIVLWLLRIRPNQSLDTNH